MGTLNINNIRIGMELAEDLTNFEGRILLKAGAILNEKHLITLNTWGITEAEIVEVDENQLDEPALDALDEEISARIDHELSYLFQKNNMKDLVIAEIYRLVKNRRIRHLIHE